MIFSRTYRYHSSLPAEDLKGRLVGKHVTVHNLDFEVSEKDQELRIIPHAEDDQSIKTLPITHIVFKGNGSKTQVVINSKMRKIDSGGPMLIVIFCAVMLIGAFIFFLLGKSEYTSFTYTFGGLGLLIFAIFWTRMETGYFDYVRKIRDYVKKSVA